MSRRHEPGPDFNTDEDTLRLEWDGSPPRHPSRLAKGQETRFQQPLPRDQADPLTKLELWAHGRVFASHDVSNAVSVEHSFDWRPSGAADWVSVRAVSKRGWAMTSAFYSPGERWRNKQPMDCDLNIRITGLTAEQMSKASVQIWDRDPALLGAHRIRSLSAAEAIPAEVPVTATVVVTVPGLPTKEARVFEGTGVRRIIDQIAAGNEREKPLREWATYQAVIDECKNGTLRFEF